MTCRFIDAAAHLIAADLPPKVRPGGDSRMTDSPKARSLIHSFHPWSLRLKAPPRCRLLQGLSAARIESEDSAAVCDIDRAEHLAR